MNAKDTGQFLGIPPTTLKRWVQEGLLKVAGGGGPRQEFNFGFGDVVRAFIIKALKAQGAKNADVRTIAWQLRDYEFDPNMPPDVEPGPEMTFSVLPTLICKGPLIACAHWPIMFDEHTMGALLDSFKEGKLPGVIGNWWGEALVRDMPDIAPYIEGLPPSVVSERVAGNIVAMTKQYIKHLMALRPSAARMEAIHEFDSRVTELTRWIDNLDELADDQRTVKNARKRVLGYARWLKSKMRSPSIKAKAQRKGGR